MKIIALLGALLALTSAKPNGVYHEEYQYKSSAQSFKNNELQHSNDDQGFYSKDGDLEGRITPKVKSHDQHSEYVNPRLQHGYQDGSNSLGSIYDQGTGSSYSSIYDQAGLTSGYGAHGASGAYGTHGTSGAYGTHGASGTYGSQGASGAMGMQGSRGRIGSSGAYGTNGAYGTSSGYSVHGGYTGSSSSSSGMLSQLTQRLQQDLTRQMQNAVRNQYRQSASYSYGTSQMQSDLRELQEELRQNLTMQLQEALNTQYGSQSIRNGYSYPMTGSIVSPTASYSTHELEQLKRQLEDDLIRQLNEQVRTAYTTSSQSSSSYQTIGGSAPVSQYYPVSVTHSNVHRQFTPIPNPDSITIIASRVQDELNNHLNSLLHEAQSRYLDRANDYLTVTDFNNYIENLRHQLRSNLTTFLDNEISRNYGTQVIRNSYSYSVTTDGEQSPNHNYKVSDLENLKRQVEQHLTSKLERDFETIKQRFVQQKQSQSISYSPAYRPVHSNTNNRLVTSNMYNQHTNTDATSLMGSQISSYELNNMQRQLQEDLSRQLQAALRRHQYQQSDTYTSSSSFNPNQNYQMELQRLTEELRRNLTQSLDHSLQNKLGSSSSSSSSYSWSGSAGGSSSPYSNQVEVLKGQLQNDLLQQLQQGLQQSYSKYSSFSAQSSYGGGASYGYGSSGHHDSSNSYGSSGDYQQMLNDEANYDCMQGDDPTVVYSHGVTDDDVDVVQKPMRIGFDYSFGGSHQRSSALSASGSTAGGQYHLSSNHHISLPKHSSDFHLGSIGGGLSSSRSFTYGGRVGSRHQSGYGSSHYGQDSSRYTPTNTYGSQNSRGLATGRAEIELGQQIEDDDESLTQQTEDDDFGRIENQDQLTQQVEDDGFGKLETLNQKNQKDQLTQQTEEDGFGKFEVVGQKQLDDDLTQKTEDDGFSNIEVLNQVRRNNKLQTGYLNSHSKQSDDDGLRQKTEDDFRNFESSGSQFRQSGSRQKFTETDFTQQIQTPFGKREKPIGQSTSGLYGQGQVATDDDVDLTQQTEDSGLRNLDLTHQKPVNEDLHQQSDVSIDLSNPNYKLDLGRNNLNSHISLGGYRSGSHKYQSQNIHSTGRLYGQGKTEIDSEDVEGLTQQTEDNGFGNFDLTGQKPANENEDLHQKTEASVQLELSNPKYKLYNQQTQGNFGQLQRGYHTNRHYSSQTSHHSTHGFTQTGQSQTNDIDDLTQKTEGNDYKNFETTNQPELIRTASQVVVNQKPEDQNLVQQSEENAFGSMAIVNQNKYRNEQSGVQEQVGQQEDDTDLTQQTEDDFGMQLGQQSDDTDLTQQTEDGFGSFETANQNKIQVQPLAAVQTLGKNTERGFLSSTDDDFNTFEATTQKYGRNRASEETQFQLGQQEDETDLTQQVEDDDFTGVQSGSQTLGKDRSVEEINGQAKVNFGHEINADAIAQQRESELFAASQFYNQNSNRNKYSTRQQPANLPQAPNTVSSIRGFHVETTGQGNLQFGGSQLQTGSSQYTTEKIIDHPDLTQQQIEDDDDFRRVQGHSISAGGYLNVNKLHIGNEPGLLGQKDNQTPLAVSTGNTDTYSDRLYGQNRQTGITGSSSVFETSYKPSHTTTTQFGRHQSGNSYNQYTSGGSQSGSFNLQYPGSNTNSHTTEDNSLEKDADLTRKIIALQSGYNTFGGQSTSQTSSGNQQISHKATSDDENEEHMTLGQKLVHEDYMRTLNKQSQRGEIEAPEDSDINTSGALSGQSKYGFGSSYNTGSSGIGIGLSLDTSSQHISDNAHHQRGDIEVPDESNINTLGDISGHSKYGSTSSYRTHHTGTSGGSQQILDDSLESDSQHKLGGIGYSSSDHSFHSGGSGSQQHSLNNVDYSSNGGHAYHSGGYGSLGSGGLYSNIIHPGVSGGLASGSEVDSTGSHHISGQSSLSRTQGTRYVYGSRGSASLANGPGYTNKLAEDSNVAPGADIDSTGMVGGAGSASSSYGHHYSSSWSYQHGSPKYTSHNGVISTSGNLNEAGSVATTNIGVKTRPKITHTSANSEVEIVPDVEGVLETEASTEAPGFWKRMGNKFTTGSQKVRDKLGL